VNQRITHALLPAGVVLLCAGINGCVARSAMETFVFLRDPRLILVGGEYYGTDPPTRRDVEAEPGPDRAIPAKPPEPMDDFLEAGWGLYDATQAKQIATALARSRPSMVYVLYGDDADMPAAMGLLEQLKAAGLPAELADLRAPVRESETTDDGTSKDP